MRKGCAPLRLLLVPICRISPVHRSAGLRNPAGNAENLLAAYSHVQVPFFHFPSVRVKQAYSI